MLTMFLNLIISKAINLFFYHYVLLMSAHLFCKYFCILYFLNIKNNDQHNLQI